MILNLDYIKTENSLKKFYILKNYTIKKQTVLFDDFEKGKITPEDFISSSKNLKI